MAEIAAVIPTLGASLHLAACVRALRRDGGNGLEIVVVAQGVAPARLRELETELGPAVDRWIAVGANRGFAGGTDLGIAATHTPYVATVNDDAVVEPGWTAALLDALETDPGLAAVQGVNAGLSDPEVIDGWGLAWNRWWQAVQRGHGEPVTRAPPEPRDVFGVSATAAMYRRRALDAVGGGFDESLESWYEDVELAVRLRAAGWRALCVPAARARHAGGATGGAMPSRYRALLTGNRWLVVARMLGWRFWPAVPRLLARDLVDVARRPAALPGVAWGWARAARRLGRFARLGEPLVYPEEFRSCGAEPG